VTFPFTTKETWAWWESGIFEAFLFNLHTLVHYLSIKKRRGRQLKLMKRYTTLGVYKIS